MASSKKSKVSKSRKLDSDVYIYQSPSSLRSAINSARAFTDKNVRGLGSTSKHLLSLSHGRKIVNGKGSGPAKELTGSQLTSQLSRPDLGPSSFAIASSSDFMKRSPQKICAKCLSPSEYVFQRLCPLCDAEEEKQKMSAKLSLHKPKDIQRFSDTAATLLPSHVEQMQTALAATRQDSTKTPASLAPISNYERHFAARTIQRKWRLQTLRAAMRRNDTELARRRQNVLRLQCAVRVLRAVREVNRRRYVRKYRLAFKFFDQVKCCSYDIVRGYFDAVRMVACVKFTCS